MQVQDQWKNILDRDVLKDSIQMIALFITVYEMLEDTIISRPKDFFTVVDWDEKAKKEYSKRVLSLYDPQTCPGIPQQRKDLISSLIWFKNLGAIDDNDIKVFADFKKLRNTLVHEMLSSMAEGGAKLTDQFVHLYALFCKIERWWIVEIEIPISGEYVMDEITEGDVMSDNMVVLNAIMDILANNSNANYKDLCDLIGVPVK